MLRVHAELFCHIGHNIGLADRLPALDRQSLIGIGTSDKIRIYKPLTRHLVHRPKDCLVGNTPATQGQQEFHTIVVLLVAGGSRHV